MKNSLNFPTFSILCQQKLQINYNNNNNNKKSEGEKLEETIATIFCLLEAFNFLAKKKKNR